ncbi:MAG: precorrin-3B C(17)-methyltransferase [Candidatus Melainabacteria bacterium RIFOXYA2_FULL_32_9]|nr:MAG: precorrin-3B C(17)-methyltransferase [Candidatus Melainabacteria bacterium RIFOXYA2_FULL_32_9]
MSKGEIYIVSTGTGNIQQLTGNAVECLNKADLIVGYSKYIKDIESLIEGKEIYSTGMTHEVDRCKYAVQETLKSKKVALISNGDANVYGMAGLVLEIIDANNLWDKLEVVIEPGITSILTAAAKAGAPIMHDFAVISLSNLLTPIELIYKRLNNALEADFVLGLYNPLSHSRKEPYAKFLEVLKQHRKEDTPVVIAQNLGRDNETIYIKTVKDLLEFKDDMKMINMSTILIIGSSATKLVNSGKNVITKRGYQQNYDYQLQ